MKKILLLALLLIFTVNLQAQKDTINYIGALPQQDISRPATAGNVTIRARDMRLLLCLWNK